MREKPILMSAEMVQAILDGRKTMTRRVIKPQPQNVPADAYMDAYNHSPLWNFWLPDNRVVNTVGPNEKTFHWKAPYQPGDRLWVRETYRMCDCKAEGCKGLYYKADAPEILAKWKPSILLPKKYARIWLEVVSFRVERVREISEEGAKAEGVDPGPFLGIGVDESKAYRYAFRDIWNKLNDKRGFSWDSNPWVWVIEFKRVDGGNRTA